MARTLVRASQDHQTINSQMTRHRGIVRGNPKQSELVRRITAEDESMRMPPVYSAHKLTKQEIERLIEWIAQAVSQATEPMLLLLFLFPRPKRVPMRFRSPKGVWDTY